MRTAALQSVFQGMKQDVPRHQLGRGIVWNLIDWLPARLDSPIRKRGGWVHGSPVAGSGSSAPQVAYGPFAAGAKVVKVGSDGKWYSVTADAAEAQIGATTYSAVNPFWFHRDRLFTGIYGTALAYWPGSGSIANVAAGPLASVGTVYKDRSVAANGKVGATDYPQRIWFSAAGDPLTWDLTNSYIDASFTVIALAALKNQILVFGDVRMERILGSTPPVVTDIGDMRRDPLFEIGCMDARSVVIYGDLVYFANKLGIWRTDGAAPEDLTAGIGLSGYWQNLVSGYAAGWTVAAQVLGGMLMVSVTDNTGLCRDVIVIDITRLSIVRFSNLPARQFVSIGSGAEVYMARADSPRLARLSSLLLPAAANASDADGDAVLPVLETPYYEDQPGFKRWSELFVDYELDAGALGTGPTLEVGVQTDQYVAGYTTIGSFPASTPTRRDSMPIRYDSEGAAFRIRQIGASVDTRLRSLDASVEMLEQQRVR